LENSQKILILGVTASGKGTLAFELARSLGAHLISIDSMKVYRRMDIGTAKPPADKRNQIPWYLIDVVEPHESFSVDRFLDLTHQAIHDITAAGKPIVAVGGTAMYIKALLYGLFDGPGTDPAIRDRLRAEIAQVGLTALHRRLAQIDPQAAQRIHPNDEKRIIRALEVHELSGRPISALQKQWDRSDPSDWTVIGIRRPKELESKRINLRVKRMIDQGLIEEVRSLLAEPKPMSKQARAAIGYAEIIEHLEGKMTLEDTIELIKINTRRLAKAQRTWFKTFRQIRWIDVEEDTPLETVLQQTLSFLK
jgi:tRNA dimethylallyltransferase